jgi:hypothetical protein
VGGSLTGSGIGALRATPHNNDKATLSSDGRAHSVAAGPSLSRESSRHAFSGSGALSAGTGAARRAPRALAKNRSTSGLVDYRHGVAVYVKGANLAAATTFPQRPTQRQKTPSLQGL